MTANRTKGEGRERKEGKSKVVESQRIKCERQRREGDEQMQSQFGPRAFIFSKCCR